MHAGGCVLFVLATSCYRPRAEGACHAQCDPTIGACPGELTCMADGLCHDPSDPTCPLSTDGPDAGPIPLGHNIVFVTSETFAVGLLGSAAIADTKCRDAAVAAKLPGTYKAYLATKLALATDRLSATARGWVRRDGKPFVDLLTDLADGRILYPPRIDENGKDHGNDGIAVATGAAADGSVKLNCDDYSGTNQTTNQITVGRADGGTKTWSDATSVGCGSTVHLYCFGIDHTEPLAFVPPSGKHAFVTFGTFIPQGSTGRAVADGKCMTEAGVGGLGGGVFVALLPTTSDAARTHAGGNGPWLRKDGVSIGTLDAPEAPLDVTSQGEYSDGAGGVWSGADDSNKTGTIAGTCNDWKNAGSGGLIGDTTRSRLADFYNVGTSDCAQPRALRCVEM